MTEKDKRKTAAITGGVIGLGLLLWLCHKTKGTSYGPPQIIKIYPDKGIGLTSVNGSVARIEAFPGGSWLDIHDGPGTDTYPSNDTMGAGFQTSNWPMHPYWLSLSRSIMTFYIDPAQIPLGAKINKVIYNFYTYQVYDQLNCQPQWALVTSNPTTPNNLVPADYQRLGNTAISTVLDYCQEQGWHFLDFLPSYLSLIQPGQILSIGLREMKYDAANIEPPNSPPYYASGIDILTMNYQDYTLWPYLEVTYQPLLGEYK
jgi:hypothetical protein